MYKIWKTLTISSSDEPKKIIENLKNSGYKLSLWIEDVFLNKKNEIKLSLGIYNFYRVKVSELGFEGPVELNAIYDRLTQLNFKCVPPLLALYLRSIYDDQAKGEWLRIATPINSLIDSDDIPHLPKLGQGLGFFFLETYWSYPKAIFHPHNDFVVIK
jgi:hypothetical protein